MAAQFGAATAAATSSSSSISTALSPLSPSTTLSSLDASSTSSPGEATSLPTPPSTTAPKPIKLRAACNLCFSAKVRCDGNKKGCHRCSEKGRSCIYSESRVGKVVGKRRKRPIRDPVENLHSQTWAVSTTATIQSIPSPANTQQGCDEQARRHCNQPVWTSFLSGSDQEFLNFDDTTDSLDAVEMAGSRSFSVASELSLFPHSGLPTPTLSPPLFARYLSPIQPQTRPPSRQAFTPVDPSKLHPQSYGAPLSQKPHATPDDEETVCIKLLAHLKRHGQDESQHHETQIELLKKSNAAVRRILQNKMLRSDYACQLVLSSIVNHLVCLCERLCGQSRLDADEARNANSQCLQDQLHFEAGPPFANYAIQHQPCSPSDQEMMVALVEDVLYFTSSTGDMLKKKPISGFQTLGRHETFHVELEQRLKRAIALIRS